MKVMGPLLFFFLDKISYTEPHTVTPVGERELGLTLEISSYTEI